MTDYLWTTFPVDKRRQLEAEQSSHEEDLLKLRQEKYTNSLGFEPDRLAPESEIIEDVRKTLAPHYQSWIDKVGTKTGDRLRIPKWLAGLCEIGPDMMAEVVIRTAVTLLFSRRNSMDRYGNTDVETTLRPQALALEVATRVIEILNYRRAKQQSLDNWRQAQQFHKQWTRRRLIGFARQVNLFPDITWREKCDFGHHMIRIAQGAGALDIFNVYTKMPNGRLSVRSFVNLGDSLMKNLRERHESILDLMLPQYRPMVCRPTPHTPKESGGAVFSWFRRKSVFAAAPDGTDEPILSEDEAKVLNILQSTEWCINTKVLDVMHVLFRANNGEAGLPLYSQPDFKMDTPYPGDSDREAKLQWKREKREKKHAWRAEEGRRRKLNVRLAEAKRLSKYDCFWHAWFADFRSRKYTATEVLSPQGGDWDKALLLFAQPREQTKSGLYWLKVHIANLWDKDKGTTFNDRVRWVDDNMKMFLAIAKDPIEHKNLWISSKTKKNPSFQRLAAVYDLVESLEKGTTRLPVQLDGSCNGAQHWAAIMRDPDLAEVVNIKHTRVPGDLYQKVADNATRICKEKSDPWSELFLTHWNGAIDRSVAKRPTMCDPYGITFYGIKTYARMELKDWIPNKDLLMATSSLAHTMDSALSGVLANPNKGKEWLKSVASICNNEQRSIEWKTYTGFRVVHKYPKIRMRRSWSSLYKSQLNLMFGEFIPSSVSPRDVMFGIAPNFTHSVDASHMSLTILRCHYEGIVNFCMIHDSYGVPAPDVDILRGIILETFVELHRWDPLQNFKDDVSKLCSAELPDLPERGTFNISEALDATYMFS